VPVRERGAFAGLWKGGPITSWTIITCDSTCSRVAATIHDRMPVILADPEILGAWRDADVSVNQALSVCGALPAERISDRPANPGAARGPGSA
jgi:putative SOS response-associated peptidase YedK